MFRPKRFSRHTANRKTHAAGSAGLRLPHAQNKPASSVPPYPESDSEPAHVAGLRDGLAGQQSGDWWSRMFCDEITDDERSEYWEAYHNGMAQRTKGDAND